MMKIGAVIFSLLQIWTVVQAQATQNIVDIAVATTDFSTLVAAVTEAGLAATLSGDGPFTVFAPNNAAFAKYKDLDTIIADTAALKELLLNHVVNEKILSAAVGASGGASFTTLGGKTVTIALTATGASINNANIGQFDIMGTNGVIHEIDAVLTFDGTVPAVTLPDSEAGGCYDLSGGGVCSCDADVCSKPLCEAKGKTWTDGCDICIPSECVAPPNIVDVAVAAGKFTTLITAITGIGYLDLLKTTDPLTVFAPTDEAFAKYEGLAALSADPTAMGTLLANHVVAQKIYSADVTDGQTFTTLGQKTITINLSGDMPMANNANIIGFDVEGSNGVIHVLDAVLTFDDPLLNLLELALSSGVSPTIAQAIRDSDLASTLEGEGPFTVFVPTEEAFSALGDIEEFLKDEAAAQALLMNHLVPGKFMSSEMTAGRTFRTVGGKILTIGDAGNTVNNAKITITDVEASNGVIHVIDAVLDFGPTQNIVEYASASDSFSTLVTAVTKAGLVEALSGDGPMTVFAPNNAAFTKVKDLDAILADTVALKELLLNHVIAGKITSAYGGGTHTTLGGKTITVTTPTGSEPPAINNANLLGYDFMVTNGVIHEIDAVLTFEEDVVEASIEAEKTSRSPTSSPTKAPADQPSSASSKSITCALIGVAGLFFAL